MTPAPIRITSVGGPTAVLEYGGLRLLTDPTFGPPGEYPRPSGPPLVKTHGPAIAAADIGAIDVVLVSHDHHEDNLDGAGRELLPLAGHVVTTRAGAERIGGGAIGLAPWESWQAPGDVRVTAVPAQHGPDAVAEAMGPVVGFALEAPAAPRVYVSGDNASTAVVGQIVERLGTFEIAILFAGAARRPGIDDVLTLDAARAAEAARLLGARAVVPLHVDGWEHFTETAADVERAFAAAGLADVLLVPRPGQPTPL